MKTLRNILDRIPVDNKLLTSFLTIAATRAVLYFGLDVEDPLIGTAISLAVGAIVGYRTSNEGSMLRREQESGNAAVPDDVDHEAEPIVTE